MPKITLLLVDDHQLVLDAWTFMLNSDERFEVMGITNKPDTALALATAGRPNVVLCDINMLPVDGMAITKKIRLLSPGSKIIGVSVHSIPAYARKMLQAGASGYVTKNSSLEELKTAILEVSEGRKYICREIKEKLAMAELATDTEDGVDKLTKKEIDVIQAVKEGLSSKEIALKLHVAIKTVEVHRYNILRKLRLRNTAALINFMNTRSL